MMCEAAGSSAFLTALTIVTKMMVSWHLDPMNVLKTDSHCQVHMLYLQLALQYLLCKLCLISFCYMDLVVVLTDISVQ